MKSYIVNIYVCNKYPCIPVQISHNIISVIDFIKKITKLSENDIKSILYEDVYAFPENYDDDDFLFQSLTKELKTEKYSIWEMPIEYFDDFKACVNSYAKNLWLQKPCLHDTFRIVIVRTNSDGTISNQFTDAHKYLW